MNESIKIGEKSDFTCKLFIDELLEDTSLCQSLFLHTVFKKCTFKNVNFQFSDFEGCEFQDSNFISCIFTNSDMRSITMNDCEFIQCNFEHIHLSDLQPTMSKFSECSFSNSTILGGQFIHTELFSCSFTWATILHCKFLNCRIIEMRIAECTFLYHIFDNTEFLNVKMNVDSLGYQYGLSLSQISSLKLIYLSEEQGGTASELIHKIREEFILRNWHLASILISVTIDNMPMLWALEKIIDGFTSIVKNNLCLKRDETKFISNLLLFLKIKGNVPLRSIQYGSSELYKILKRDEISYLNKDIIREMHSNFFILANELSDDFDKMMSQIDEIGESKFGIILTIHHAKKPLFTISNLLKCDFSFLTDEDMNSELIHEWDGSWYEMIALTTATLTALLTTTTLIKGVLRQFLDIKILYNAIRGQINIPVEIKREIVNNVFKGNIKPISKNEKLAREMLGRGIDAKITDLPLLLAKTDEAMKNIEELSIAKNTKNNGKRQRLTGNKRQN